MPNWGGKIVNITSTAANKAGFDSYNVAKSGVATFSQGLAIALAPYNICVNCVAPGEALTSAEMSSYYNKTGDNYYFELQPNHRFTRVEDVASAVLFLASDQANNITGNSIMVDGGWSINNK